MLKVCADHPSVLKLVDYFEDAIYIHLVTEQIEGPDLFDYIKQVKVDELGLKEIMKKLLNGLGYLHNLGVVHRDIKLENIMIGLTGDKTKTINPKLIDFGLSTVLGPGEQTKDVCGTLAYCSPELVKKQAYESKTDVWSLGIVAYSVLRGKLPFVAESKK